MLAVPFSSVSVSSCVGCRKDAVHRCRWRCARARLIIPAAAASRCPGEPAAARATGRLARAVTVATTRWPRVFLASRSRRCDFLLILISKEFCLGRAVHHKYGHFQCSTILSSLMNCSEVIFPTIFSWF